MRIQYNGKSKILIRLAELVNQKAVAEDLEQIPQMGEDKAKYALKTHHRIAVDKGISGADEHSQAHQQPKGQLHLGDFGDRVFFDLIGHNRRPFL